MKILYVASKYDYGNRERGYGVEYYNYYNTLVKMNEGRNLVVYFALEQVEEKGRDAAGYELLDIAYREKPNLIFFANSDDAIKPEVIRELTEKSGAITFNWFADDHWKFDRYSRWWAPLFHWVSTTDSQVLRKYASIGYANVIHSQWASNNFIYQKRDLPYKYDVSFVGVPYGKRRLMIEKLNNAGIKVVCFGKGWPAGHVSQDEMISIFSQSKINLNFTAGSGVLWKELGYLVVSRRWDRSIRANNPLHYPYLLRSMLGTFRKQIKGRNFEVPGCGGFLLTNYADNLKDYYEIGKEIVVYEGTRDLIEKIRYYLEHDAEREEIARAGYERTLRDHTFERRFNDIFKAMGLEYRS